MDEKRVRELAKAMRIQVEKIIPLSKEIVLLMKYAEELYNVVNGRDDTPPIPPSKSDKVGKIIEFRKQ